jgi:AraC family transcriptional regulator, transcriptional activator of pobA
MDIPKLSFAQSGLPFEVKPLAAIDPSFKSSPPHRTDFYTVIFIQSGSGKHFIDFQEYPIQPNTLFFLSPSNIHSMAVDGDINGYICVFTAEFIGLDSLEFSVLQSLPFWRIEGQSPYLLLSEVTATALHQIILKLENEYTGDLPNRISMLKAYLNIFLITAGRVMDGQSSGTAITGKQLIQKFASLLEEYFAEKKKVSDYAAQRGLIN